MKKLLIILTICLLPFIGWGQNYSVPTIKTPSDFGNTVYIDPSGSNGDGSIGSPYNTLSGLTIQSNTAYLIKSGETLTENVSKVWNNNYVGKYGTGDMPVINGSFTISDNSSDFTMDSLHLTKQGNSNYDQILRLSDNGLFDITIANSEIIGLKGASEYPYYCIKGNGTRVTFYHNIIAYSGNDGFYTGYIPECKFVSNYFHHNNMNGIVNTNSTGDGIQFENAQANNGYIANNYIDRQHTIWKFALIVNATLASQSDLVCEWNTFIGPRTGNGGSAVRWLGGTTNTFRKNLINTTQGLDGITGYPEHANQTSPYGIRDNHKFGAGDLSPMTLDASNLDFADEAAYQSYLTSEGISAYGSDIDTSDFWSGGGSVTNPCAISPIGISGVVGNDTNNRGTGFVDITVTGGYTGKTYSWSNGETTEDISGLLAGQYSVTVTDDSSCSSFANYTVNYIDTISIDSTGIQLTIDTVYANLEDGVNVATNMLDGDFNTRWSNNLDTAIAVFVLNNTYLIDQIRIAWYEGNERKADFKILVSTDSVNYTEVYSDSSSGDTLGYEIYDVMDAFGKYIKLEGYGNNKEVSKDWTSITEFRAWGDVASGCVDINLSAVITNESDGGGDGSIDLTATGGSGSLSYLWSPGNETTEDLTNLSTGEYSVIVTDDSSCTAEAIYNVYNNISIGGGNDTTVIDSFKINLTQAGTTETGWTNLTSNADQNVDLGGGNSLDIDVFGSGGISSPGETGSGPYPDNVMLYYWQIASYMDFIFTFNDTADVLIDIHAMSSREPFVGSELWTTFIVGEDSVDVSLEGNITPTIFENIDPDGSKQVTLKSINGPADGGGRVNSVIAYQKEVSTGSTVVYPLDVTINQTNIDCYGDSTGSIELTPFNGVGPYTHSWNIDSTGNSISNLPAGTYTNTIRDANDSILVSTHTVTQNDSIYYEYRVTNPTDEYDGNIVINTITGGNGVYSVEWNTGSTSLTISVTPGNYWFIITDGLGCKTDTVNITVEGYTCTSDILITGITTPDYNFQSVGTITTTISGVASPYTVTWDDNPTAGQNRTGLAAGAYRIIVTDANNCINDTTSFTVLYEYRNTLDSIYVGVDNTLGKWTKKINLGIDETNTRLSLSLSKLQGGRSQTYQDRCTISNRWADQFPSVTDTLNYQTDTLGGFRNFNNQLLFLEGTTD
jgi:hypothetical protein